MTFDFFTPEVAEHEVQTDGLGDYYMDGATRVPVYAASAQELSDAHVESTGGGFDFISAAWDSTSNRPSSYLALGFADATNLANQYNGSSDPNILLNVPELPLPQLATQAEACACTDNNADGACD